MIDRSPMETGGGLLKTASVLAVTACIISITLIAIPRTAGASPADVQGPGVFAKHEQACTGVTISKGIRFQSVIDQSPKGQKFCWESGKYFVRRPLVPKDGQMFVAVRPGETVLDGRGDTRIAFDGVNISNAVLDGLVIRDFATPVEDGLAAIRTGDGWTVRNSTIKKNGSAGIFHGSNVVISNNFVHHNGQYGIVGYRSKNALIVGNEVAHNNTLRLTQSAEGGSKWTGTSGLVLRDNYFHHNLGNGIWVDGDNVDVLIEENRAVSNEGKGIHYEISCAGVIRNNRSTRNGESGIEIVASRNLEVYGNIVKNNGFGIRLWDQERGGGSNCEWKLRDVNVYRNTITMTEGYTGVERCCGVTGDLAFTSGNVRFNENVYYIDLQAQSFRWLDDARTVQEWVAFGQDVGSEFHPLP